MKKDICDGTAGTQYVNFATSSIEPSYSATRPRILFIAHTLPFPENSGTNIRLANLLRAALSIGDVKFVGYVEEGHPEDARNLDAIAHLRELCPDAEILPRDPVWWPPIAQNSFIAAIKHYVLSSGPFIFREFRCHELIEAAKILADEADLIWIERMWVAYHLPEYGSKAVVDLDDLESLKTSRRLAGRRQDLPTLAARFDNWKTRLAETRVLDVFRRAVVCSERDARFWPRANGRVWTIPNGFDERLLEMDIPKNAPCRAIFVGTLNYWPNVEAAKLFAKYALPIILARYPNFEFWVVGKSPLPEALALENGSSIRVFCDVPNIIDYVRQAQVSVVPLRVGGGTRLKILESIGAGVPVISSDVGIEGIDLQPEKHYFRANTSEEFAEAVVRIIEQPALGHQQVESARREIAGKYGWASIQRKMASHLLELWGEMHPVQEDQT